VILLTRMFLSATKTLGAETTPIVMSLLASLRSSVASLFAVSSEYYTCGEDIALVLAGDMRSKEQTSLFKKS
jgi:hypothetical protein